MSEATFTIGHADPRIVLGSNDQNLRKVCEAFPATRITVRGNKLILGGEESSFAPIEKVFAEMERVLRKRGRLSDNDVDTILSVHQTNGVDASEIDAGVDPVIVSTPTGGAIRPRTQNQRRLVTAVHKHDIVFAIGPAGTGKTYTAVALALAELRARRVRKIVLSRPAVEAGEQLGFLPGDLRDKVDPYLRPLYDALGDMMHRDKLNVFIDQNSVEIVPLAYMRGRTLNNAFVILDEAQNATAEQMKMFLTRIGINSKAIVTGDDTQIDLPQKNRSGLIHAQRVLANVAGIEFVAFDKTDVVRHRLVKDIIEAYENYDDQPGPAGTS